MTTIITEVREGAGKGVSRKLRDANKVPAIVYGANKDPMSVALDGHSLLLAMNAGGFFTNMIELKMGDKVEKVLARDIQRHPVTEQVQHVDFLRYDPSQKLKVNVAVKVVDEEESPGLKKGGVLQMVRAEVEVICRADNIPNEIIVSMAGKDIGDSAHISEVTLPEGVVPSVDRDFTIASVVGTRTSTMATLDAEAEAEAEGAEGEEAPAEGGEEEASEE